MLLNNIVNEIESIVPGIVGIDLSRLLGFRDLAGVGSDESDIAAALDAANVKIGEFPVFPARVS